MSISNKEIINLATELGFQLVGFSPVEKLEKERKKLEEWISLGYQAGMKYMENNLDKREDVCLILNSAKSVISLGINYFNGEEFPIPNENFGKISRYAWGKDYHLIVWEKLKILIEKIQHLEPTFEAKSYIDTGPLMDKAWAVRSGIGWLGKHTNVINREIGSWFFIANIITNYKFDYSIPHEDFCGSCTACLDACPTGAIVNEYVVDSNKCISYLTIENKREINNKFNGKFENWLFGCDICQDVCPWNNKFSNITIADEFKTNQKNKTFELSYILNMNSEDFKNEFNESPILRSKSKGIKRNAEFLLNKKKNL